MTITLTSCVQATQSQRESSKEVAALTTPSILPETLHSGIETYPGPDGQAMPTVTEVCLPTRREKPLSLLSRLTLDEYALVNPPVFEPLTFLPIQGSQACILAKLNDERLKTYPDNSFFDGKDYAMRTQLGADELVARQQYNETGSAGWVTLLRNGEEIYRVSTGPGGPLPIPALLGLWAYDDHWVLETAQIIQRQEGDLMIKEPVGQISQDGKLLNDLYGYEELFGFQLMAGEPFYFFTQDGMIGFAYGGQVVMAGYDEIPYYGCCSSGALNPISAENMIAFFAKRDKVWYYVEIGVYEDISIPEGVVSAFLDDVSKGDLSGAKRFWKPEVWNPGIEKMVAGWAAGRHEFSLGAVSYAGFVAPGDYRPLEADDPRVLDALVTASIDGFPGSFALEKTSSGWLISGWLEPDKLQE
ncbi:MAG: hypothetical protein A2W35_13020 [Chloroflexi bacterium RBG_16_57_11]|nr:MAG: hypothetical protein A2W35_13020 [Chloroflexi bacterium RBG_16_57_11]